VYRWVNHTAELELHLEAPTEEAVFEEALTALGDLLTERSEDLDTGAPARFDVHASAPDRPTLLAEWLSELVYLVETQGLLPEGVEGLALTHDSLEATVAGRRSSPAHLVKAVTYHRLSLEQRDGAWHATVVLDV
jgi:SHS2 domain-containing protein